MFLLYANLLKFFISCHCLQQLYPWLSRVHDLTEMNNMHYKMNNIHFGEKKSRQFLPLEAVFLKRNQDIL